jgi:hypothetical protein
VWFLKMASAAVEDVMVAAVGMAPRLSSKARHQQRLARGEKHTGATRVEITPRKNFVFLCDGVSP